MRHWILNFALAATVLIFASDAAATSFRSGDNFSVSRTDVRAVDGNYIESIDMLFRANGTQSLDLGTSVGSISVKTWPYEHVRLVVDKRVSAATEIDARAIFSMFRIQALQGDAGLELIARARTAEAEKMGVTFTVYVPRSYKVNVRTKSGDIAIPEVDGGFKAHTSDGRISVDCKTDRLDIELDDRTAADADSRVVRMRSR